MTGWAVNDSHTHQYAHLLVHRTWRVQAKFNLIIGVEHYLSNSLIFLEGGTIYLHLSLVFISS